MALLFELVSSVVGLALKPVLLAKLSCQFGARSLYFVVQTWLELLRFALGLHFVMLWRLAIWIMALLSLPVRAFTALYRERLVIYFNLIFLVRILMLLILAYPPFGDYLVLNYSALLP